jgi:hypothetical protein
MGSVPRRFVTRACVVCEWTGAAVERYSDAPSCPWCHAPTKIVREEWLVEANALRDQAAAFGRIGGLKGGRVRAERLSPKRRKEIARAAAAARWRRR